MRKGDSLGRRRGLGILNPFGKMYKNIKLDEEKRKKSVRFGWLSIVFSLFCVGLAYPCVIWGAKAIVWSFTTFMGFFTYFLGLGNLFVGCLSLAIFLIPYYLWIHGISLVIMQLTLNKKAVGWIALVIWLASVVGIVWLSYLSFNNLMAQVGLGA